MSLRSQAALDLQAIYTQDGEDIVLTDPDSIDHEIKGMVNRRDAQIDPDTGIQITAPVTSITVALADLSTDPTEEWSVATTDVQGNALSGQVRDPRFDRTRGELTFFLEAVN